MESGYLSIKEASKYLGMKESTLYSMVEEKEIPHFRIGRRIRFKVADLDAWMVERRVESVDVDKEVHKILTPPRKRSTDVNALA
jgi:excisionase family DNA binding protein